MGNFCIPVTNFSRDTYSHGFASNHRNMYVDKLDSVVGGQLAVVVVVGLVAAFSRFPHLSGLSPLMVPEHELRQLLDAYIDSRSPSSVLSREHSEVNLKNTRKWWLLRAVLLFLQLKSNNNQPDQ